MTVVFDSGVWISALEYGGTPRRAIECAEAEDTILICTQLEDEVLRIMTRKFGQAPDIIRVRMRELAKGSTLVTVTGKLIGVCRDPDDDFILECAALGRADLIVTGDKDLLSLASFQGIRIVTARQYLDNAPD